MSETLALFVLAATIALLVHADALVVHWEAWHERRDARALRAYADRVVIRERLQRYV